MPGPGHYRRRQARGTKGNDMTEAPWVRSVYLYLMTAVSVVLIGLGAAHAVVGFVHTLAPDLGHRDTIDRVGIGLSNIAGEVVDLIGETQQDSVESYCEDVTDSESDFDECVEEEEELQDDSMSSIQDGIAEVKDELRSQIRNNSFDRFLRGLIMIAAGLVLFRIHGRRTELFADGVIPSRGDADDRPADPEPIGAGTIPPPPPAPPLQ